jgi:hypothetical protein
MRFNLRLHGRTGSGQECQADISVYASSQKELMDEAKKAATSAAWLSRQPPHEPITEGEHITVEHVERL